MNHLKLFLCISVLMGGVGRGQGYGTLLMEEAERISRTEHRSTRLAVISGVGTRHYYRKLGYALEGPYMIKELDACPSRRRRSAP